MIPFPGAVVEGHNREIDAIIRYVQGIWGSIADDDSDEHCAIGHLRLANDKEVRRRRSLPWPGHEQNHDQAARSSERKPKDSASGGGSHWLKPFVGVCFGCPTAVRVRFDVPLFVIQGERAHRV